MQYIDFSSFVYEEIKKLELTGFDNHYLAIKVFEIAEANKYLVSESVYNEFVNRNVLLFAKKLSEQVEIFLKSDSRWLEKKPDTGDFPTRFQAIKAAFVLFKSQTQDSEILNSVQFYEGKIDKANKEGCYIATMVYGSYFHPQVLILRSFRDQYLRKYYLGRLFINIYYYLSPKFVVFLKNRNKINIFIRVVLNKLIDQAINTRAKGSKGTVNK